jgi:hypothetical protein
MSKKNRKQQIRRRLYKKYGWLIDMPASELPAEHKANLGGGLRCFRTVYARDSNGNKTKEKKRCGKPAVKGSLFCQKHGGANTNALVHGKTADKMQMYRNTYSNELGDVLHAFMTDPDIIDMKPELATLRTVLNNYIAMLARAEPKSPKRMCKIFKIILENEDSTALEKYQAVKSVIEEQTGLTDGRAIDRINRTVDTIGKTIERMNRIANKDQFIFTPDGYRLLLRAVVDVIRNVVQDIELQKRIKQELLNISTMTGGELVNYDGGDIIDVKGTGVDEKTENT